MDERCSDDRGIDALWRALHAHVQCRIPRDEQAEDIVQETWLRRLVAPPERFDRLTVWMRVVAQRLITERLRARRSRLRREQAVARPEVVPEAGEELEQRESRALELVRDLREPYGQVVRLHYIEGWKIDAIARHTRRPVGTVRCQIKRGLDILRARLGPCEGGVRDAEEDSAQGR